MRRALRRFAPLAMLAGIALSAGSAHADVVLTLNGSPTLISTGTYAGDYQYNYTATLQSDSTISSTDYVTVYDIPGYVAGSAAAVTANPNFASGGINDHLVGVTPFSAAPPDNPAINNVTYNYSGATKSTTLGNTLNLGTISFVSQIGLVTSSPTVWYAAATTRTSNGGVANNQSQVIGPAAIPEPSPMVLSAVAAGLVGLGYRFRGRKARTA